MEGHKAPRERGNDSPLARARMAAGMTQGQMAAALGCSQKDVSRWERGVHSPRVDVLIKMADVLGCRIDDLRSKPGISRLFSFDYRFDYNKKSKTAYGRPNDPYLPRMKDWGLC